MDISKKLSNIVLRLFIKSNSTFGFNRKIRKR